MTGNQQSENKKYFLIKENAENTRKYYMLISLVSLDVFFYHYSKNFHFDQNTGEYTELEEVKSYENPEDSTNIS